MLKLLLQVMFPTGRSYGIVSVVHHDPKREHKEELEVYYYYHYYGCIFSVAYPYSARIGYKNPF